MDQEKRIENYKRVQEIVAEELPHINLHQLEQVFAVSDKVDFTPRLNEMFIIEDIKRK